jgi:hypothetical protein
MTAFRSRAWAKPIISVAAAGLGAAVAGPLGGALGGWIGDALGGSTSKLLENLSEKFGEKAAEKLLDVGGDSLADKLKPASPHLERAYREALRQSLRTIGAQPDLRGFADWFGHWDLRLAASEPLDLSVLGGEGTPQQDRTVLVWQILVSLDAQGKAMGEKELRIVERRRAMPDALQAALSARLPQTLRAAFNALIVKPEYEAAWKQAERAFQDALKLALVDIDKTTRQIHRNTNKLRKDSKAIRKTLASIASSRLQALDLPASGVSTDFGASIREFLSLYAPSATTSDIFGGRERDLAQLTEWLENETAAPYRLILGSAGRGKSMLLVRWAISIAAVADLDVVFIPISIRCQTNTASAVLQALVSRLARLFGDQPSLIGVTPTVLCDLARGYLQKQRPSGRRTLLILDGLDEAVDKDVFRGLLPTNPPRSLRVVLAARPQAALGTEEDGWRAQLGFGVLAPRARRALLHVEPLDRLNAEHIHAIVVPVVSGIIETTFVSQTADELFRLSDGEPFILALYLQRLVDTCPHDGAIMLGRLRNLEPGLGACLRDWWNEQSTLWTEERVDEQAAVAVLAILAVAHGPMAVDEIQAVVGLPLSGYAIRGALIHLNRFVIATSGGQRVTVFHERLAEFVTTVLISKADLEALEQRFVDWILTAASPTEDVGKPVPEYVLRHTGSHLHGRVVDLGRLTPLLSRTRANAWLKLEGNHSGFIEDVNGIVHRAMEIYRTSNHQDSRSRAFLTAVDAALVRSSAISVAESLPHALLPVLVCDRIWTSAQALAYVRTIQKDDKRISALKAVADAIDPSVYRAFIDVCFSLDNTNQTPNVLALIAEKAAKWSASEFLEAVARLGRPIQRARALRRFDSSVSNPIRQATQELLADARLSAEENYGLAHVALSQAFHVPAEQRLSKLLEAVQLARAVTAAEGSISDLGLFEKVDILCALAEAWNDPEISKALVLEGMNVYRSSSSNEFEEHAFTFEEHAFTFNVKTFAKWAFPEALEYARELETRRPDSDMVRQLIGEYDSYRWPQFADEVDAIVTATLSEVTKIPDFRFYYATYYLKRRLGGMHLPTFAAAIFRMSDLEFLWKSEITRLTLTTGFAKESLAVALFEQCSRLDTKSWISEIMAGIVVCLPHEQRRKAAEATLLASRTVHDEYSCVEELTAMLKHVEGTTATLSELAIRKLLTHPASFASALSSHSVRPTEQHIRDIISALEPVEEHEKCRGLVAVAANAITEPAISCYCSCAATIKSRRHRVGATFALLGIGTRVVDTGEVREWLVASSEDEPRKELVLPTRLNALQVALLEEILGDIPNSQIRIYVGNRIKKKLRTRNSWSAYFADLLDAIRKGSLTRMSTEAWCSIANDCDSVEIRDLAAVAETLSSEAYSAILLRAIEVLEVQEVRDDLARKLLNKVAESFTFDPSHPYLPRPDILEILNSLSRSNVSDDVFKSFDESLMALDSVETGKLRLYLASMIDHAAAGKYIEAARSEWPPSDRIKFIAKAFQWLSREDRNELFAAMTEWIETYYCGAEVITFLTMSEQCNAEAKQTASAALWQLERSARIGGSVTEVERFLHIINSWMKTARINDLDARVIIADLFERITPQGRSDVLNILGQMSTSLPALSGVDVAEMINRVVLILADWP